MKHKKIISAAAILTMLPSSVFANVNYTTQKGDSYWSIAQKFNTSLSAILSENGASNDSYLTIGQKVIVPSNTYTVQKGDTYYLIAKKCGVTLSKLLTENNASESSVLYPGQKVKIPSQKTNCTVYTVQKGDTYYLIAKKYGITLSELLAANNASSNTTLYIGQFINIPKRSNISSESPSKPSVSYTTYTVKDNDTLWNIALKHKIPFSELLEANSLTESDYIFTGMKLTIPIHNIPVKYAPPGYGELLDWFSEAQYVVPINADFKLTDLQTGKSFNARRTVGSGHADCEPLTANDTAIMKSIWGGTLNWNKRSVLVTCNGRTIAASASGTLHAGNDSSPGGAWTSWRSGDYGAGINYDYIKGNGADGHFDLYFYNSIGHNSPTTNSAHQNNVLKSAGK